MSPFRKSKQYSCYNNIGSNHPRYIFKQIPNDIMLRLSTNSSNIDTFTQNKHDYEMVQEIVVTRPNLFIKPWIKHYMYVIIIIIMSRRLRGYP